MSSNEAGGAADNAAAAERRKIDATIMSFLAVSSAPPPDRRLTHFNANIKSFLGETAAESLLPAPAATGATTNSSTMSTAAVSHKTSFRQQQQQQQQQHVDHLEDQKVMSDFDRIAIMREGCSQIFIKDACFGREIANAALASAKELLGSGRLRCAGMGRGKTSWSHTTYRSDSIMWVTNGAGGVGKALDAVVRVLERRLRSDLHLPANRVSVQLAHYAPGSGGFVKHIDAWKYSRPQEEHGDITAATGKDTVENDRILTAIYYLNEGWSEGDGGCLRVHSAQLPSDAPPESDTVDVQPLADRLVMFRSDVVEHEVLPCQAARFAITVWFYRGEALPPRLPPPLPLPSPASLADVTSPIFVSIASHRDPETPLTIEDCFARAAAPERIHVGVLLQLSLESGRGPPLDVALAADMDRGSQWGGKVTILSADSSSAAGPVPARAVARSLWQGEPYVLQIDSHMRFRPNWDVFLISQLQACPSAKPILTTYPPDYFPKPSPPPSETRPTVLVPSGFGEQDGLLRQKARLLNRVAEAPLPSPLWAAGFSFSTASALLEVPYDPLLRHIFFGEEISMAARLYTSGFDFYAPSENVLYHLWSRADRPNFREQRPKTAKEEEKAALLRLRALLIGSSEGGESAVRYSSHFGLGSVRPIQEFEKGVRCCFRTTTLLQGAECAGLESTDFHNPSEDEATVVTSWIAHKLNSI